MQFPFGCTITVIRARQADPDPYSGEPATDDWENPTTVGTFGACARWKGSTLEPLQDARQAVSTTMTLILPGVGHDVRRTDRVLMDDLPGVWLIEGDPYPWTNAFTGWQPGTEVIVKRVEG